MSIHHLQERPDSCVAASMCVIQRWRGEAPTEEAFRRGNSSRDPMMIARLLPRVVVRIVGVGDEHELQLPLRQDKLVAVTAIGHNYRTWCTRRFPQLRSSHGSVGSELHVVVLWQRLRDGFRFWDPFYPVEGQPLEVSDDDFVGWFAGHAFIASR